jgi:hypothetical protein
MNKHITIHDVINNMDLPWDKLGVSNNPNMTPDVMREYGHLFEFDTSCINLTMCDEEYIETHIENLVGDDGMFAHSTVISLHNNKNITIQFVERNIKRFSESFHVADLLYSVKFGDDITRLDECIENIVTLFVRDRCPPGMPGEVVNEFRQSLWDSISANEHFLEITEDDIVKAVRKILMASRIKRQFKRSISDPSYQMCVRRLIREFSEAVSETASEAI